MPSITEAGEAILNISGAGGLDAATHNAANDDATANFVSIQENVRANNTKTATQSMLSDILMNGNSQAVKGLETSTTGQSSVTSNQAQKVARLF